MNQINRINYGKDIVEPAIAKAINAKRSALNSIGVDLIGKYNVTYEVKYFSTGNRPSLTGLLVDFDKTLSQNIDDRLFASRYVVCFSLEEVENFFTDYEVVDDIAYIILTKAEFKKWISKKTILDKSSKGKWQLRINKYERTKHQDAKLKAKGL